ncbi:uncharacterized protein LOC112343155 [Selaginella moellendorffii]|uniref:uncharacterized protein LOC112343155 n=1 Tax=Selaginella moellendorffii TaxID=88036 RepID=UPI000D1C5B8E|nr:uncharacterized protein LOC112343155 [Selaginella moellendorffii]XP_024521976.1 uncharacterized protein LOC112343155 [Selaginella moellendorffii]|eukprot:XP_024521975.1 uncharacterized protein LOC112343155 [Selaginella moellendorffii]
MDERQRLDIDSIQLDDPSDCCDTPPVSPSAKDRRKKKKKKNKSYYSNPASIQAFDEGRQQKLAEEKSRQLHKPSTFASSEPCAIPLRTSKAFEYEDAHALDSSPSSPYPLSSSCPLFSLRSALRGGHEGLGLGPRPKLHVKWAVDVRDPPKSSVSHTLNRHNSSRKKRSKSKTKTKSGGLKPFNSGSMMEGQEVVPCAPDSPVSEDETVGLTGGLFPPRNLTFTLEELHSNSAWSSSKSFFASMEVAMQHMLLASSFIEQGNIAGALIEYKAAANVFRLAKLDSETEGRSECRTAAVRGQVLAWIAMATLYSASGQSLKGQKCHNLALEACQEVGMSYKDSIQCVENFPAAHQFKGNGGSNHCSLAAALSSASSACEASRTEKTSVCI